MIKYTPKNRVLWGNILLSIAVSLLVNFSYLLVLFESHNSDKDRPEWLEEYEARQVVIDTEGTLHIMPDGYGFLVMDEGSVVDSVYVNSGRVWRFGLKEGDRMRVTALTPEIEGAHHSLFTIETLNGKEHDYAARFDKPDTSSQTVLQIICYALLMFVVLTIVTRSSRKSSIFKRYFLPYLLSLLIVAAFFFAAPVLGIKGDVPRNSLDIVLMLKCMFVYVVAVLYARIYDLVYQRQRIEIKNAQLKNENLTTRYSALVSQISPHFLFNSLNSLSMLVREKLNEKALTYIDRLSHVFRYVIQNGQNTLSTVADELQFIDSYRYLLEVRYADKLFFEIDIDPAYMERQMPSLALQPLIENAVKHNAITRSKPLTISIFTKDGKIVVSNPIIPKIEAELSTGIGLKNLSTRWQMITGHDIEVIRTDDSFEVHLPLLPETK
ncbi:MAG: histidine kinase [Rikenellaceae bacterium]|nr:histidine kinase [Rikenellaceae bacterium]